jgi:hypothetical protein
MEKDLKAIFNLMPMPVTTHVFTDDSQKGMKSNNFVTY